jgi:hypothetical protein
MIDHMRHANEVVKEEVAKAALANGIDKTFAGFVVTPLGQTPMQAPDGRLSLVPAWLVMVTLRVELIGQPPVVAMAILPGMLPDDEALRQTASAALGQAVSERDSRMRGDATG